MPSSDPFALRSVTHTSQSHPLVLVPVEVGAWTLFATIPPGCKGIVSHEDYGLIDIDRDMSADVEALASHGIGRLVSMMSADDILMSGLGGLLTDLDGAGIDWSHLPFPNRRFPDESFACYLAEQVSIVRIELSEGRKVALHGKDWGLAFQRNSTALIQCLDESLRPSDASSAALAALCIGRALVPM